MPKQIPVQLPILALHRGVELVPDKVRQAGQIQSLGVEDNLAGAVSGQAVPSRIIWRRPLMVRQPYSVAVLSTE